MDDALRAACHMSDETGETGDEDAHKADEAEFFTASAHGEDRTRETWQKWYDSPQEKRRRGER